MTAGHGDKLTRKQEQAIAALLTEPTVQAAAAKAKIGERTLRGWMKRAAFLAAWREARRRVVESAIGRIQQAASRAVDALERNLTCGQPANEIRAALGIVEHAVKAVEILDLEDRLSQLEQRLEGGQR